MTLTSGSRVGPYEVVSPLGEGGMGVVFRARDTKLQRNVALKLLPDHLADNAERLARFEREAQVLASLNHPNIAQIYGLEEAGAQACIVMELVEGETLEERIRRGAIPPGDAFPIAAQICDALQAAHEKGVIHRDLKPANIKITPAGQVKVLDFGLATALEHSPSNPGLTNSPTLNMAATSAGVILGTAAYMSPEQAKGLAADARSDVFALGCVLYEMLTGKQAFKGETISDILASVLAREPDLARLPSNLHPKVHELLRRCLAKNPKQRWHAVADLAFELQSPFAPDAEAASAAGPARKPSYLAWGLVALVAIVAVATVLLFRPTASLPETRVEINTPPTPQPLHFAMSPDGRQLVFVAAADGAQKLWLRPLGASESHPLAGTDGAEYPFWSPDGRSIGFFASGKMKRIDIGGGPPQSIADAAAGRGGAWNTDGTILLAVSNASPIWRVPASGGQPMPVTRLDLPRQGSHRFPQFLPDGKHFIFFAQGSPEAQGIYLGSLDGTAPTRLMPADSAGGYIDPGWLLFNRQGALMARRLNLDKAALDGESVTVAETVNYDTLFNLGGFSVSRSGTIAYRVGAAQRRQLTWFDRTGRAVGNVGEPDTADLRDVDISPDGRHVAVTRTVQDNMDIWILDMARGTPTRFTFDAAIDEFAAWSPDGASIAFSSNRKGIFDLFRRPSTGAGADQLLLESPHVKLPTHWSADGRYVLYTDADPKTGYDLWALPVTTEGKPVLVVNAPFEEREGQFSPDGRWVAYQSNESGRFEIYVQPFPEPRGKWQVSTAGGTSPRWRRDGKEIYFTSLDRKMMAAAVQVSGPTFESAAPVVLFQTQIATGGNANLRQQYDVSPDGRFLLNTVTETATVPISLILNWAPRP